MKTAKTYNSVSSYKNVKSVTIKIDCSNAAFDGNFAIEVKSLLEEVIRSINGSNDLWSFNLKDHNGNSCGSLTVE
jgi:hypothetical protein